MRRRFTLSLVAALTAGCLFATPSAMGDGVYRPVALKRSITRVQPMTGIVLWSDNPANRTDAIALEYSYVRSRG